MFEKYSKFKLERPGQWLLLASLFVFVIYIALCFVPMIFQSPQQRTQIVMILLWGGLYAFLALGLNVVCGFTGLLHLGYGGFMCVGAFATAILMKRYEWTFWATLPVSVMMGLLLAFILGLPTLRLSGDYFAIVTFGFSELVVFTAKQWTSLTGGTDGISGWDRPSFLGYKFTTKITSPDAWVGMWVLSLTFVFLLTLFIIKLKRSRLGRAWISIRENELVSQCLGVNQTYYKLQAFLISGAIGALGGSLMTVTVISGVTFQSFMFMQSSVMILICVVLGGLGSVRGALMGGFFVGALKAYLQDVVNRPAVAKYVSPDATMIAFALLLIFLMLFRPQGIINIRKAKKHRRVAEGEKGALYTLEPGMQAQDKSP